ncbi:serine/threonine protein kinase [uncultured Providencia sp.]|uniref:serine/threonine protein kinase n=1 Tax=uncultured Providencia sp. TaxID=390517 RepID=UPI0030102CE3
MNIRIEDIIGRPFTFTRKPEYLPCEMRPMWRASLIILIFTLVASRTGYCSLKKIHVINWLLKSEKNANDFLFWVLNQNGVKPEVRMDPTLDRAIEILLAEGILSQENSKFKLTEKGNLFSTRLLSLDVFRKESAILEKNKKGLTETNITKLFQVG